MAKSKTKYICSSCGEISSKWEGQCGACNEWGTISESASDQSFSKLSHDNQPLELQSVAGDIDQELRLDTNISELNRTLGGGLVVGSAVLIGGNPGIGKSTILLQLAANIEGTIYVTGEESLDQVRLRAKRLGVNDSTIQLAAATSVDSIVKTIAQKKPKLIVIDSIQTMFVSSIESAPGTVSQVRTSTFELISACKKHGTTLILVGHVTKEGQIAGPKLLEHMVDAVLYFEGEKGNQYRILRSVKNRFGAANEIGVFEMQNKGLSEVTNPSKLFISKTAGKVSGSVVFAGIEGTRPVMLEIQALISPSFMATPRRAVVGWDMNRLSMILAVLQTRCGIKLADKEVYLNVAGGMKVIEPAADLAVAVAIISAISNVSLPQGTIVFGEVGLSGEVRSVSQTDIRMREAEKLGFEKAIVPQSSNYKTALTTNEIMSVQQIKSLFAGKE